MLNIGDMLKIPMICSAHNHETKPSPGGKKGLQGDEKERAECMVLSEINRAVSTKDNTALELQQKVVALPYGPKLVPAPNDIES